MPCLYNQAEYDIITNNRRRGKQRVFSPFCPAFGRDLFVTRCYARKETMFTVSTQSSEETAELAQKAGQRIREGTVLCLIGDLGAGKTLFTQNLVKMLGVDTEVTSPTFSLMNVYEGICPILHFDLYRIEKEDELDELGFYEYVEEPGGIVIIEWADKFPEALPDEYVTVTFEKTDSANERNISFACHGEKDKDFLKELAEIC